MLIHNFVIFIYTESSSFSPLFIFVVEPLLDERRRYNLTISKLTSDRTKLRQDNLKMRKSMKSLRKIIVDLRKDVLKRKMEFTIQTAILQNKIELLEKQNPQTNRTVVC